MTSPIFEDGMTSQSTKHHRLEKSELIYLFYYGLNPNHRTILNTSARGNFMNQPEDEAWKVIEDMRIYHQDWTTEEPSQTKEVERLGANIEEVEIELKKWRNPPSPALQTH